MTAAERLHGAFAPLVMPFTAEDIGFGMPRLAGGQDAPRNEGDRLRRS